MVAFGAKRGRKAKAAKGRSPLGTFALTVVQRQRLHRARKALRELVCELRGTDVEVEACPPCKRVLSVAERQQIHRARRALKAL